MTLLKQLLLDGIQSKHINGTLTLGHVEYDPPFKATGDWVVDTKGTSLCKCETHKIAQDLVDLLYDLV